MDSPELTAFLQEWLGAWPPVENAVQVVSSPRRTEPTWDGSVVEILGIATDHSAVISVPPGIAEQMSAVPPEANLEQGLDFVARELSRITATVGSIHQARFRWSVSPSPHRLSDEPTGEWLPTSDQRVPAWLRPFNDEVLIVWDDNGGYGAGVGIKKHNDFGYEISVGTEPALAGQGIAKKLVATATNWIVESGRVATYLHEFDNLASAKVAQACGFDDKGWRVLGYSRTGKGGF